MNRRTINTNKYEVVIYNKEVRKLVEFHETHPRWGDDWAEQRYIELPAADIRTVIRKIRSKYPRRHGFKITSINKIDEFSSNETERF